LGEGSSADSPLIAAAAAAAPPPSSPSLPSSPYQQGKGNDNEATSAAAPLTSEEEKRLTRAKALLAKLVTYHPSTTTSLGAIHRALHGDNETHLGGAAPDPPAGAPISSTPPNAEHTTNRWSR